MAQRYLCCVLLATGLRFVLRRSIKAGRRNFPGAPPQSPRLMESQTMTTKTYRQRLTATSPAEWLAARRVPGAGGCLLWTGCLNRYGYGQISVGGKKTLAHRLAWLTENGPVPAGLHVLHRCDVPACINPAHLFLGTNADNMADKVAKGRSSSGERHGRAKLTDAAVRSIRVRLAASETCASIARDFGVSRETISDIKTGRAWSHVAV